MVYSRIFSKSKSHKHKDLNYSDGIVIPDTFFALMRPEHQILAKKLLNNGLLIVRITDNRTFFNIDLNRVRRRQLLFNSDSYHSTDDKSLMCHVSTVTEIDDDIIHIPNWMFKQLRIKEGDPIALKVDLSFSQMQIVEPQTVTLKCLNSESVSMSEVEFKEKVLKCLGKFKILRSGQVITMSIDSIEQRFEIVKIEPESYEYYINAHPQSLIVDLINFSDRYQSLQVPKEQDKVRQNIDLNEIIRTQGLLDLDLLENALKHKQEQIRLQAQKRKLQRVRRHQTMGTKVHDPLFDETLIKESQRAKFSRFDTKRLDLTIQEVDQHGHETLESQPNQEKYHYLTLDQRLKRPSTLQMKSESQSSRTANLSPAKFNAIIKKKDEILNLRSMSAEFKNKIQQRDRAKPDLFIEFKPEQCVLDADIVQKTLPQSDSFCQSYYGQILQKKLTDFNDAKQIQIAALENKQTLINKRPLTQGMHRHSQFILKHREARLKQRQSSVVVEQYSLKLQLNKMALKKGRLPLSIPGTLKQMFTKYKKIMHVNQLSAKQSTVDFYKTENVGAKTTGTMSRVQTPITIARKKPLLEKEEQKKLNIGLNPKSIRYQRTTRKSSHQLARSLIKPWNGNNILISDHFASKQHKYLLNDLHDINHTLERQDSPIINQHSMFDDNFLSHDHSRSLIKHEARLLNHDLINEDYARGNSFKFQFVDNQQIKDNHTVQSSPQKQTMSPQNNREVRKVEIVKRQPVIVQHHQVRAKTAIATQRTQVQQTKWKLAQIKEIKPDLKSKRKNKLQLNVSQRIHENPSNLMKPITSPQFMLKKRERNLRTLIQKPLYKQKLCDLKLTLRVASANQKQRDPSRLVLDLNNRANFDIETNFDGSGTYIAQNVGIGNQDSLPGLTTSSPDRMSEYANYMKFL